MKYLDEIFVSRRQQQNFRTPERASIFEYVDFSKDYTDEVSRYLKFVSEIYLG